MARRSKEQMLAEFHRIYDVSEVLFDIGCEIGLYDAEDRKLLISRARYLELVKNREATLSQCISGIMQAINDFVLLPSDASTEEVALHGYVRHRYKEMTGSNLFSDLEDPVSLAKKIVKKAKITTDEEHYVLKEILIAVDQTVFSSDETIRAEEMLSEYGSLAAGKP